MYSNEFDTYHEGVRTHRHYVESSDTFRRLSVSPFPRLAERLGARLITLGRRLYERRGTLAVEITFRTPEPEQKNKRVVA